MKQSEGTAMRNKPFLVSSIIFGLIGIALVAVAGISFITNSTVVAKALVSIIGGSQSNLSNSLLAELGVVFMVPSFIFAYKSFADSEEED